MKLDFIFLCFLMVSHNLAQHTTSEDQREKQDLSGEILYELNQNSKTLGLCLEQMNAMGEQMKLLKNNADMVEDKIEDGFKSMGNQIHSVEDKMEDGFKSMGNQISSLEDTIPSLVLCVNDKPCNCLDVMRCGNTKNGVYTIYLNNKPTQVYCDMETDGGGWLVFQRRADGSENFYRGWNDYKDGFGNLTSEFWQGNEDLYQILNTCGNQHELRVDLEDFDNETRYAKYFTFNIENQADNYRLRLGGYSGNAGDSLAFHNGQQFTTFDRDNDLYGSNCAELSKGGWWYNECHFSNLNGLYLSGPYTGIHIGVAWYNWKGYNYSLKFTEMKFRLK